MKRIISFLESLQLLLIRKTRQNIVMTQNNPKINKRNIERDLLRAASSAMSTHFCPRLITRTNLTKRVKMRIILRLRISNYQILSSSKLKILRICKNLYHPLIIWWNRSKPFKKKSPSLTPLRKLPIIIRFCDISRILRLPLEFKILWFRTRDHCHTLKDRI